MTRPHPLTLILEHGGEIGQRFKPSVPCTVGSGLEAGLQLRNRGVAAEHGRFEEDGGVFYYCTRDSEMTSTHHRAGEQYTLDGPHDRVELWDDDLVCLGTGEDSVHLRVRLDDSIDGVVLAERPIEKIEEYTHRLTSEFSRLGVLYRASSSLGRSTDLAAVGEASAQLVFDLLPVATHMAIALKEKGGRCEIVAAKARDGGHAETPVSRTLVAKVFKKRSGLLLTDASAELAGTQSIVQAGLASTMSVPLWTGDRIRGVLQVDNRDKPGLFSGEDLEALTVAAGHISFAVENARLVEQLQLAEQKLAGENKYLKARARDILPTGLIGESPEMLTVLENIGKVCNTRVPVLVTGETGTGKELVARAVHYNSNRADKLFVPQNCSSLPDSLLESELFGHSKGAFTGADRDKKGLFELADGGTIFLDELGEMPMALQAKLLRVLQEGEIWPIGAPRPKRVDVRVVSATHRNLEAMVAEGAFREDLFYRLFVYPIHLPPLRARQHDIIPIAEHFLTIYSEQFGRRPMAFTAEATSRLKAYLWPGNIRELQNEIQRLLIHCQDAEIIEARDLSPRVLGGTNLADHESIRKGSLKEKMESVEKLFLIRALSEHGNNKTKTAADLGITREGLHKKLNRFGLT